MVCRIGRGSAPPPSLETHYAQFDGVDDYAWAAAFAGLTDFTAAVKLSGFPTGSNGSRVFATGAPPGAETATYRDRIVKSSSTAMQAGGVNAAGTMLYSGTSGALADAPMVCAISRVGDTAYVRIAQAGVIAYTLDDTSAAAQAVNHLSIAANLSAALVAANFLGVRLISAMVASVRVPDADLIAWLAAQTAVGNVGGMSSLWNLADMVGAEVPAQVGTVPLSIVGDPTLVPL